MVTTIFCICSLRTNVVFFSALFTLIFAFGSAAGAFWNIALGNADLGKKLTIVSLPTSNTLTESLGAKLTNLTHTRQQGRLRGR
jgi:hypothetical protein